MKLPTEWNVDRLKDISEINRSSLGTTTDPYFEFPYLEISNVDYYGVIDNDAIEKVTFEDAPSRARRRVFQSCTIISSVRPNLQAAAYFPADVKGLICSTGFNVVEPLENHVVPRFLYYVLISEYARQYFEAVATGVGYPAVADKFFGTIEIPLPPLSEQILIAGFLNKTLSFVDSTALLASTSRGSNGNDDPRPKGLLTRQAEALVEYRKSLIHECITGKRRITTSNVKQVEEAHV